MVWLYSLIGFICFLSMFWGIWSSNYFLSSYNFQGFGQILPQDMAYMIFAVGMPIILLLFVGVILFIAMSNHQNRDVLLNILSGNKAQMSSLQTVSRALIEVRKLGFTNQFFLNLPIILNDISICLADIISKTGMASDVVIFDALNKNGDNRLYSVCKIILDLRESTPHFDENLRRKVKKDMTIAGSIGIFSLKYNKLLKILKNYDLDGFVYSLIEEGELGKVHNILSMSVHSSENIVKSMANDEDLQSIFQNKEEEESETEISRKVNIDEIMKLVDDNVEE
ncbi:hypothetical protein HDR60_02075 [bacterium]|nr:hypothetical protein [bacterium]